MPAIAVWIIALVTVAAIVVRPFGIAEWIWAVVGAAAVVAAHLLGGAQAAQAARDGLPVYAFLLGMLALAELARVQGLFDWISVTLAQRAASDTRRLFLWSFCGAIVVTALLSNDGTILLLTPAALALARGAKIAVAPFAFAIAFVANAASFILPISNPANLVVFSPLPQLVPWLTVFAAPSAIALVVTFAVLRALHARDLRGPYSTPPEAPVLTPSASLTAIVVAVALAIIIVAAGLGWPVGYVAFAVGVLAVIAIGIRERASFVAVAREAPWSVIPLVGGLFVIVRAVDETGALEHARAILRQASAMPHVLGQLYAGGVVTVADALINNLPAGVVVRYALQGDGIAPHVAHAALIGIDLGPNLSLSASLATLLWAIMLRREGIEINPWRFLLIGTMVTIPSLALALLTVR